MRRMRAEQIRYRFGRNFLSFCGMCCFNLIRYGTYQQEMKAHRTSVMHCWTLLCFHFTPISNPTLPEVITGCAVCHGMRETGSVIYCKADTAPSLQALVLGTDQKEVSRVR